MRAFDEMARFLARRIANSDPSGALKALSDAVTGRIFETHTVSRIPRLAVFYAPRTRAQEFLA